MAARDAASGRAVRRTPRQPGKRGPGRPPAADSAATEAAILAAARVCFARRGFERTTNRDIADEAGIAAGTIYHYFASKPALFVAVGEEVASGFFGRFLDAVGDDDPSLRQQLRLLLDILRTMNAEDPSTVAFMAVWAIEVSRHDELRELVGGDGLDRPLAFYRDRADRAMRDGQLRRGTSADGVAGMITAVLFGLALLTQAGHGGDLVGPACDALEQLVDVELFA